MDLKFNLRVRIQYAIDYGVVSPKSVLCRVSTDGMRLVLEKVTPTNISNYYEALLIQIVPTKVDIDTSISNILAENSLIKVHHLKIAHDKLNTNVTKKKSENHIPKIAQLTYLPGAVTPL